MESILTNLTKTQKNWLESIQATREMLLGNLSMTAELPAQTLYERDRAQFILSRFTESGILEPQTDKLHNAIGQIDGNGSRNIVVCTHMDNAFELGIDQNIAISEESVHGAGVADDNISVAVLLTLPDILRHIGLTFNSNIILLATTRYHGRGDFEGMRSFIKNNRKNIDAVINLNGINFGSLNYFTLSRVRCDINCEIDDGNREGTWLKMSGGSAILTINEIIESLYKIPLPRKPKTLLNVGMIHGGERYSSVSRDAQINLEVLSEDDGIMDRLIEDINIRCVDIGAKHGARVTADFFGRHTASSLSSGHPLVKNSLEVIKQLGCSPRMEYTNSQITVSLAEGIPSVNLGLTTGLGGSTNKSYIDIAPLNLGILQLVMLLHAIDNTGDWA